MSSQSLSNEREKNEEEKKAWKISEKNISEGMNLKVVPREELETIMKVGAMLAQQIPNWHLTDVSNQ